MFQDEAGRLWDVLYLLRCAIRRDADRPEIRFGVHVRDDNREAPPPLVRLKALWGQGDKGEPLITVMELGQLLSKCAKEGGHVGPQLLPCFALSLGEIGERHRARRPAKSMSRCQRLSVIGSVRPTGGLASLATPVQRMRSAFSHSSAWPRSRAFSLSSKLAVSLPRPEAAEAAAAAL
jgi:hypothetical protein